MKYVLFSVFTVIFANAALAKDGPTADYCKAGYKKEYSGQWTKAEFKKACAKLAKKG